MHDPNVTIWNNFQVNVFVSLPMFMGIRKGNINFFCWAYAPTHSSASVWELYPECLPEHQPLPLEVTVILSLMVITSLVLFILGVVKKRPAGPEINKQDRSLQNKHLTLVPLLPFPGAAVTNMGTVSLDHCWPRTLCSGDTVMSDTAGTRQLFLLSVSKGASVEKLNWKIHWFLSDNSTLFFWL